jgi:hypothetical protein
MALQAKSVVNQCQVIADAPIAGLPHKVLVWSYNPRHQVDGLGHAHMRALASERRADPGDKEVTVLFVVDSQYVQDHARKFERFDYKVAIVTLPGPKPVGVLSIKGDEHPLQRPRDTPHPENFPKRLAGWVERYLQ